MREKKQCAKKTAYLILHKWWQWLCWVLECQ